VRLSPLGTSATIWPIVPAPDDRWVCSSRWNENWKGKPKDSEKTRPSATLSTTNPTWPDLGSNPGRRGGKPATNRLSYGTAQLVTYPDTNPVHTSTPYFCKIPFNNILSSFKSPKWSLSLITKLIIMQYSPSSCHFFFCTLKA
jgi:hypothetical protein